ncbi:MAG: FtsX-like permease family protein [Trueperaceae bacterium]
MKLPEILRTAVGNAFRSKVRTTLTILAIFVGAFTLTLTNGVGTGVTNYIDSQVASFGDTDSMLITQASLAESGAFGAAASGPVEFDPDQVQLASGMGAQFEALSDADLDTMRAITGVESVEPLLMATPDFIKGPNGRMFVMTLNPSPAGASVALTAGSTIAASETASQLLLPTSYVEPMGFASDAEAVGATVLIGVSDVFGKRHEVEAVVAGVQEDSLLAFGMLVSQGLTVDLYRAQTTGLPDFVASIYPAATARLAANANVNAVKAELEEAGFAGQTLADQMGSINAVVNGIVGVLNAFAVIALIAAGFGIVNTLLMSVQERTREIGLMKAMGMGGRSIFALFSAEAVFIGFLGSAIGSVIAIALGSVISSVLAAGPLSDLAGLRVLEFDPLTVVGVIAVVMLLAFLSGTLPAARAARLDPIDALRYE